MNSTRIIKGHAEIDALIGSRSPIKSAMETSGVASFRHIAHGAPATLQVGHLQVFLLSRYILELLLNGPLQRTSSITGICSSIS